jgi:tRNA-uridine 2-sulfurtransferase
MGGQSDKILKVKAIALFSGGLDSILAAKVIQGLGIEVEGVTFETPFFSAKKAEAAAKVIGLSLTVIDITETHLHMLQAPRYGYGKNMNPCIDCHTLMLKTAGTRMEATGADFVFTGEVLGQRPMSQTKQSLHVVAKNSGYSDSILRPLSAQCLPETRPEKEGKVDRTRLLAISGRGRKSQIEMARNYGITDYAPPAGGCLLTDVNFSKRLRDLFHRQPGYTIRDIELLKHGRHFRIQDNGKIIIGRNQADNEALDALIHDGDAVLHMADKAGPTVLVPHGHRIADEAMLHIAACLCALYAGISLDREADIICTSGNAIRTMSAKPLARDTAADLLI